MTQSGRIAKNDLEKVKHHLSMELYDASVSCDGLLRDLKENGGFSSIAYDAKTREDWHPLQHLRNLLILQKAAYSPENPDYLREELVRGITRCARFWAEQDFHCDWNGWFEDIGEPLILADCLLLPLGDDDGAVRQKLTGRAARHGLRMEKKKKRVRERQVNSTGGNLTDKLMTDLKIAAAAGSMEETWWLRELLENELRVFPNRKWWAHRWDNEGIKADMGFFQHFELLYTGGYGDVFLQGVNAFLRCTNGTLFALSPASLNLYADFILDGAQYFMRNGYRDISASGRGIARPGELKSPLFSHVLEAARLLAMETRVRRGEELRRMLGARSETADRGAGGHIYFYKCDTAAYNGPRHMTTVRAASKRTKNSEALNGENVLGHYLGAGSTLFCSHGDEYEDIFPLWDWNRIPGVTAVQGYLPVGGDETYIRMGRTSFVGGCSNGAAGANCLLYRDNKVKAQKAWFLFEEGTVCLGTDIHSREKREVVTTVEQSLRRGTVLVCAQGEKRAFGDEERTERVAWVHHRDAGYLFGDGANVMIRSGERQGDWNRVSTRLPSTPHRDTVLEISLPHGPSPKNAAYEYTVLLGVDAAATEQYAKAPTLVTLCNTKRIQAVWHREKQWALAVFWKAGEMCLPNGERVEASAPCTLLYETDGGVLHASNPSQTKKNLVVTVGEKKIAISFLRGDRAGQTVTVFTGQPEISCGNLPNKM